MSGRRLIQPREAVEERGLAGAVGADQAEDLALEHVEGHAVERDDSAEHDADVANREQGRCPLRELCLRHLVSLTSFDERWGDASRSRR